MAFQLVRRARDRDADGAGVSWVRFSGACRTSPAHQL